MHWCDKSRHKWTTCWSTEPVTARVTAARVQKKQKRGSNSKGDSQEPSEKKAKVATIVAEEPLLLLPEVTEDFVFEPGVDSDEDIIW